jgi:aminopeptidase N
MDPAFRALALTLPSETYLAEFMTEVDPQATHAARQFLRQHLARALRDDWLALYRNLDDRSTYALDALSIGRRSLRNLCLSYLMELADDSLC